MDLWWCAAFAVRMRALLVGDLEGCFNCRLDGYPSGKDVVNYLASHDIGHTVRHLLDHGIDEDTALQRMQLGLVVLFTAMGIPMVWMGDEVGAGAPAEQQGHPLDWEALQRDPRRAALVRMTTNLLTARRDHGALRGDECTTLLREDSQDLLVIQRWDAVGGRAVIVLHGERGEGAAAIVAPALGRWCELLSDQVQTIEKKGQLHLRPPAWTA